MQAVDPVANRYDRRTIWLHWAVAILVVGQWLGAQTIDFFPRGPLRVDARSLHITGGLLLAAVLIIRMRWRSTEGRRLRSSDRGALKLLSHGTHYALYVMVASMLVLGLFLTFSRGDSIFNAFNLPTLWPSQKQNLEDWHGTLGTAILVLAGIHAGAALMHRYLWNDGVLSRMWPWPGRG